MQTGRIGDNVRDGAVLALVYYDIAQPLPKEIAAVMQVAGSRSKHLCVACPTEPLIALWAVRRHLDEVGALRPEGVFDQAVYQGVAGYEAARRRLHRTDRHGGNGNVTFTLPSMVTRAKRKP